MNKGKGYRRVGRIYKTVDKDKGNEERIFKTPDEDQKKEEKFHKRGEEDGANGERICNIMKKEEGIELDGLVKNKKQKKTAIGGYVGNEKKKKKKICDNKSEKYCENEDKINHYSEIDDICQNMPHFPKKPFN